MIRRITARVVLSEQHREHLENLKPHSKDLWDSPPDDIVPEIKAEIRAQLSQIQGEVCAYCGLDLGGTSEGQIEHIAPKAKYPSFTFEIENLAMACHYCNGFSKKGNHHTIAQLNDNYEQCMFKLVHPYYHIPTDHYGWVSEERKVLIVAITDEALYSIKMLKLDSLRMAELRGKKIIADIVLNTDVTPQIDDALIQDVLNYK